MTNENNPVFSSDDDSSSFLSDDLCSNELSNNQTILADNFILETDVFTEEHLSSVTLPKMLIGPTGLAKEKSFLMLTFKAVHSPSTFKEILIAAKKGINKFIIKFTNEEKTDTISKWMFTGVKVDAIDFGYIAKERSEPAAISIELSYKTIIIDDFEF